MNKEVFAKARRVKSARRMTGLSSKEFAQKSSISEGTMKIWESPGNNRNGIPQKSIGKFVSALLFQGVECSVSWIMEGVGRGPGIIEDINNAISFTSWDEEESILCEISVFKCNNPNTYVEILDNDELEPLYLKGDYLGAILQEDFEPNKLSGKICILKMHNDEICIKKFIYKKDENKIILTSINPNSTCLYPIIVAPSIFAAGPVVWIRKKHE